MKRPSILTLALLLASCSISCTVSRAQESNNQPAENREAGSSNKSDKEWYYGPTSSKQETKTLGRQRAEQRAQQRFARMQAMRWYGFSASRPMATGIPFTSMYSPKWPHSGGRPVAWYTSQRPSVIFSPYAPRHYRHW